MHGQAVDDSLATLKLIPDWFILSKMIKKLFNALYANQNMLCFNEDSGNVVFNCKEMDILNIDLNSISLNNNFDEDWHIKFKKHMELKKELNEELMPVSWRPN